MLLPRLLPLLLLAPAACGASTPAGFDLTRTAQPTSPSARDPAVFNFTYALPAGASEGLDCALDRYFRGAGDAGDAGDTGALPPNSTYAWWHGDAAAGVTVTLPGLADGMHNLSCAICNGTVAPGGGVVCSAPRSVYSWLQLQTAPAATIAACPGAAPGAPQNTTTAPLAFGAACASLPGGACPAQAHVQWDSFCALGSDPSKRTPTKTSTTGQDTCTLPADWSKQEVVVHVEAYVKNIIGRGAGASCNFTSEYAPPAAPAPAPAATPATSPAPAPAAVPAPAPAAPPPAGGAVLSIVSGPPPLDTRLADFGNTKTFTYTFVLGGDGATADTAKDYECCLQDSSKTECVYAACAFPEQKYEKALRDGTHVFFLRAKAGMYSIKKF
jgi:hypothetical protein